MQIEDILQKIRKFRDDRDWMQFHNPKDMAAAISVEANELLEHFLWKNEEEVRHRAEIKRGEIQDEIADIAILLFELADNLNLNIGEAMVQKLAKNAEKYPVIKAKGSNRKYDELT